MYTEREVPSLKLLMPPKDSPVLKTGICGQKMYGTQVHVHRFLLSAKHVRTMNPDEADFFYVPGWPKCMLDAPPNGAGVSPETLSKRYVAVIRSLPYFQRSDGRDHIFLWPSGRGPTLFKDWKCHAPNSLFITPEGHYTSPYRDMVRRHGEEKHDAARTAHARNPKPDPNPKKSPPKERLDAARRDSTRVNHASYTSDRPTTLPPGAVLRPVERRGHTRVHGRAQGHVRGAK